MTSCWINSSKQTKAELSIWEANSELLGLFFMEVSSPILTSLGVP